MQECAEAKQGGLPMNGILETKWRGWSDGGWRGCGCCGRVLCVTMEQRVSMGPVWIPKEHMIHLGATWSCYTSVVQGRSGVRHVLFAPPDRRPHAPRQAPANPLPPLRPMLPNPLSFRSFISLHLAHSTLTRMDGDARCRNRCKPPKGQCAYSIQYTVYK